MQLTILLLQLLELLLNVKTCPSLKIFFRNLSVTGKKCIKLESNNKTKLVSDKIVSTKKDESATSIKKASSVTTKMAEFSSTSKQNDTSSEKPKKQQVPLYRVGTF